MSFAIVTDSVANLPRILLQKHNITSIPFTSYFSGEEYRYDCPENFDDETYYAAIQEGATFSSSQINPTRYVESMTPLLKSGHDILFIGVSSGISGSFNSACIARDE